MTYNEWRDELKSNLLCVSESERRRVLDYYAEAYADRRDAGFTEREIIADFGAPYDAAQRILGENRGNYSADEYFDEPRSIRTDRRDEERRERAEEKLRRKEEKRREREEARRLYDYDDDNGYDGYSEPRRESDKTRSSSSPKKQREDCSFLFVILCIIFCVPLFGIIMGLIGISIGLIVAPFGVLISGAGSVIGGISAMISGNILGGLCTLGVGVIVFGIGVALIAVFPRLIKLMWTIFKKVFLWIKSLFSGKECV